MLVMSVFEINYQVMKKKSSIIFAIIIVVYILLNLSLFYLPGHSYDLQLQQSWGDIALHKGLQSVYFENYIDYPPLAIYVFYFNAFLSDFLRGINFLANSPLFIMIAGVFISKIIPALANFLIGIILFFYVRKDKSAQPLFVLSMYLFNLALIYDISYWGQVDSFHTLLMLLTVIFLIKKKYIASSVFMTLAILTKFQSVALLPVVGVLLLMNCNYKKWLKIIAANLVVAMVVLWPYIPGALIRIFRVYFNSIDSYPRASMNAYNIWFLFSREMIWQQSLSDQAVFLGVTLKFIGLFLLGVYTLIVVYQLIKDHSADNIILASASLAFAFFMLPTQIHERYLFPFFAIFLLVAFKNIKYLTVYLILSITFLFNLMLVLPFPLEANIIFSSIQLYLNLLAMYFSFLNIAIAISIINVLIFIYFNKIGILKGFAVNVKKDYFYLKNKLEFLKK